MLSSAFAIAYALYALFRHWSFHSSGYDLGIFDQAIWHLSRFERPASSIAGHVTIFSDHFHPILMLIVPAYWLVPRAETLLVAQSVLLAASCIPVFLYAASRVGQSAALWITASYGLFWAMQKTAAFDFHEVAFAPLAIATAILALEQQRWRLLWASIAAICLIKEDLIPFVGMLGLRMIALGHVRHGLAAIAASVAVFVTVLAVVMPFLGEEDVYPYWSTHLAAARSGPLGLVGQLLTPPQKLLTIAMWVVPFALLPLRSPIILLALPIALGRLLGSPNHWSLSFHYSAPMAPIIAMAAADGLARLTSTYADRGVRTMVLKALPMVACVLCAFLPGRLPLWRVFSPSHYETTAAVHDGRAALAAIPSHASVVAQHAIVPHLSGRHAIYGLERGSPEADYVIATEHRTPWPNESRAEVEALLNERRARGYRTVFERGGWIVLTSLPPGMNTGSRQPNDR